MPSNLFIAFSRSAGLQQVHPPHQAVLSKAFVQSQGRPQQGVFPLIIPLAGKETQLGRRLLPGDKPDGGTFRP